jgi:hypothetical protein
MLRDALAALNRARLEAVMIGNAAAALHGAPVTTMDVDFLFRATPSNLRKLKAVSRDLHAVIMRPYYPVSKLYRLTNDDRGLQLDFMPTIHGIRSYEGVRDRASTIQIAGQSGLIACLQDIIRSKKAARARVTKPYCPSSTRRSMNKKETRKIQKPSPTRRAQLAALKHESELEMLDLIRRRLSMPVEKRTHFLRVRLPLPHGGSCL